MLRLLSEEALNEAFLDLGYDLNGGLARGEHFI